MDYYNVKKCCDFDVTSYEKYFTKPCSIAMMSEGLKKIRVDQPDSDFMDLLTDQISDQPKSTAHSMKKALDRVKSKPIDVTVTVTKPDKVEDCVKVTGNDSEVIKAVTNINMSELAAMFEDMKVEMRNIVKVQNNLMVEPKTPVTKEEDVKTPINSRAAALLKM